MGLILVCLAKPAQVKLRTIQSILSRWSPALKVGNRSNGWVVLAQCVDEFGSLRVVALYSLYDIWKLVVNGRFNRNETMKHRFFFPIDPCVAG